MKKNILIILFFGFLLAGCKKDKQTNAGGDWFLIEVRNTSNLDCRVPEIIFLNRQQEAYQIIGDSKGVYIATGLPKVLYPAGTQLYVSIQKPVMSDMIICTTMGPSYPQVQIKAVK